MNILVFSWRGPGHPNAGGAEISTHEHAKVWVKAGHNVTLFTSHFPGAKKEEIIDGVKIIRKGDQFLGVHWHVFKWYLFKNHQKFNLVVDQFHGIPFFTPIYVREKKLAFIHEIAKEVWKTNFSLIPATLGEIFEPLIYKLYKNIPFMTVSLSTKQDLISFGIDEKNITIINNGVTVPKNLRVKKEKKKTVVYLGALAKDKGTEIALDVFSYLEKLKKDWQFWVIGRGSPLYIKFLQDKARKLGLKNLKFWGYVSEKDKFHLLSKAHVSINPSIREGWGLVVIEAARVGTPTIAFNVAGLRDSIKNNQTGILTEENTSESLAAEISKLLSDTARYQKLRQGALSWSKQFSWEKAGKASLHLINKFVTS